MKRHLITQYLSNNLLCRNYYGRVLSGQSDMPLRNIRNPHHCQFGKWLDSSKIAKKSKHYNEVNTLHIEFHERAAEVAGLAISGQSKSATHKMEIGSEFSKTSAKLVNILADWKSDL